MKKLVVLFGLICLLSAPSLAMTYEPSSTGHGHYLIASSALKRERSVYFNTETYKYHVPSCKWAIRCTRNCIQIPLSDAIQRGGIPCKVCGGGR